MWKAVLLVTFGCLLFGKATSQGGAESLPFHGHLPEEYVKAKPPVADDRPNDIYEYIKLRQPELKPGEVVIYPHHFGFEYGQDPEMKIYEIHQTNELSNSGSLPEKKHHKKGKLPHQKGPSESFNNKGTGFAKSFGGSSGSSSVSLATNPKPHSYNTHPNPPPPPPPPSNSAFPPRSPRPSYSSQPKNQVRFTSPQPNAYSPSPKARPSRPVHPHFG